MHTNKGKRGNYFFGYVQDALDTRNLGWDGLINCSPIGRMVRKPNGPSSFSSVTRIPNIIYHPRQGETLISGSPQHL